MTRLAAPGEGATVFHEILEHLEAHLAHRRDLLGEFLQLVDIGHALHRLRDPVDIGRIGLLDIGQPHEPARFFGRAIDLYLDLHRANSHRAHTVPSRTWALSAALASLPLPLSANRAARP